MRKIDSDNLFSLTPFKSNIITISQLLMQDVYFKFYR